ncbi:MAG TPA: arginine N-succinyltransferase [Desulfomonilaceae bacterium]|nr:arginine N-succinyltransferase [Desulfomonilaceae bacterium]
MVVVRPVNLDDLDRLSELASSARFGLTSLPKDRDLLRKRIIESQFSFQKITEQPGGELYVFVLEDLDTATVVGTSCIVSKVGGFEPFYAYRIENTVHQSHTLHIRKEIQALNLVAEHSGPSEIGGLFLVPEYRKHGTGRLLSLFRFLFMAEHPARFEPVVIAEMRGVVDDEGYSPFWEAIGRHFFEMDYSKADLLSVMDKRFIADLMPRSPIYLPLLPKEARDVIGMVHEEAKPALKMLQDEGFIISDMVDIFEAGPIIHCRLDEIRIVQESRHVVVQEITSDPVKSIPFVMINAGRGFRAGVGNVEQGPKGGVRIRAETAEALHLDVGGKIRFGPLHVRRENR